MRALWHDLFFLLAVCFNALDLDVNILSGE